MGLGALIVGFLLLEWMFYERSHSPPPGKPAPPRPAPETRFERMVTNFVAWIVIAAIAGGILHLFTAGG